MAEHHDVVCSTGIWKFVCCVEIEDVQATVM